MSKKVCPQCSCTDISQDRYKHDQGICFVCNTCGFVGDAEEFKEQSLFDRIAASPEVMATKLVYDWGHLCHNGDIKIYWKSTILPDAVFYSKYEAIAATVVKLKEVDNA